MANTGLCQRGFFPFQTLDRFNRIAVQTSFAVDVVGQLLNTRAKVFDCVTGALFLIVQRIALDQ